jgi:hypothetical protein
MGNAPTAIRMLTIGQVLQMVFNVFGSGLRVACHV